MACFKVLFWNSLERLRKTTRKVCNSNLISPNTGYMHYCRAYQLHTFYSEEKVPQDRFISFIINHDDILTINVCNNFCNSEVTNISFLT
jgi:hypothetical protein